MVAPRLTAGAPEKMAALKRLYYDTAQVSGNPAAWDVFTSYADPSHIMFGSDSPYGNVDAMLKDLRQRKSTPAEAVAIEHGNADLLFPRFRARNALSSRRHATRTYFTPGRAGDGRIARPRRGLQGTPDGSGPRAGRARHRRASSLFRARVPDQAQGADHRIEHGRSGVREAVCLYAASVSGPDGPGGLHDGDRLQRRPRRLVRQGHPGQQPGDGARDERIRRPHGHRSSRPVWPVRLAAAAGPRREPEGNRIRVRHAEGRWRGLVVELRRPLSRRPLVCAGARGAQSPQGGGVRASEGDERFRGRRRPLASPWQST